MLVCVVAPLSAAWPTCVCLSPQVFGMPSQKGPEWGVRECIGNYPVPEQAPDADLGMSIRPGWRNVQPDGRTFGTPTIRSDISAPGLKSVADHQNYGDEVGADQLLYPPRFADGGVTSDDFLEARSQGDIAGIFASAGLQMSEEELAATYAKALPHTRPCADGAGVWCGLRGVGGGGSCRRRFFCRRLLYETTT